ncbi:carbon-nitrogen family hydrolase [Rossellomorea aquimaris]|uniref:Carbon-nitrogen family hydrolase n=1 Tax=Rossellomorea aquimaris TaxID=189382 RepID=A0A5D4TXX7_9BACI|nr:carbon-nitrogen family hydrolase [Rossellomorea aquimaris]TYS79846.1 carbon-nitrogen family hydrolase [Rossellomorea aquimaris]
MGLRIACLQIDIQYGRPEENRKNVSQEFQKLFEKEKKLDVVVLPELWTTGYDLTRLDKISDDEGKESIEFLSGLAQKYSINIVGGSVAKKSGENITNTLYSFDRSGNLLGEYSKVHLFKLMDEHHYLSAGNTSGAVTIEGVPSAAFICYDIRFPEWMRTHTAGGAEVLYVAAEWPLARVYHWRTLLLARAIENQCYVVACNRSGSDPNNEFGGHSMIIDPWGEIIAEAGEGEEVIVSELDLDKVKQVRKQIPIFQDRRPELY